MKFALFYEIPVPRPWEPESELVAYRNTLEQAIAGDRFGWHAFWTVEHHFLQEYSHCSNPEVLYGAIAARTERIRLGYGVRLMPKPYNHPVRTAESVAVLDLLSGGRVDLGTGRSATRAELEGFGVDPGESRRMWQEAIGHVVGCWTNEEYEFDGEFWQMPRAPGATQAVAEAAPAPVGRHHQRRGARPGGRPRARTVLVRRRPAPVGGQAQDRRLPRGGATLHQPHRRLRQQPGRHLHHGHLRPGPGEGEGRGPRVLRVVPEDGRPPDRHPDRLDGRAQRVARQLRLRGRHEEDRRRGPARPASAWST